MDSVKWRVINGNNIDILKEYPDNHFDAIVTDPPYGIEFLGKDWDKNTGAMETWEQCFRVLKPGGHMLAFSAARTYHHLATNVEMAGFEIRDQLMWLYGSGFPKAQDIGKAIQKRQGVEETKASVGAGKPSDKTLTPYNKEYEETVCSSPEAQQWSGWKTALKPAHEPIVMARKPFSGSCIDNVLEWGTGAMNIDATRVPTDEQIAEPKRGSAMFKQKPNPTGWNLAPEEYNPEYKSSELGRYPSNVLGEIPEYQKYFYCPKVSRKERHTGLENPGALFSGPRIEALANDPSNKMKDAEKGTGNTHPTVKPVELMKYLVKLVTPPGGRVLDPFNGSGSTGMAAVELGYEYVGCELDPNYVEIANKRIAAWEKQHDIPANNLFEDN
jgi:DNA modification methylase